MRQLLKFLVSIILIAFAIYLLDIQTIIKTIRSGSAMSFIVAITLNVLTFFVMGLRWYILITPIMRLSFVGHMAVYFRGAFMNTFTPANLGGDAYRLAVLRKNAGFSGELVKLLLRERIIGFYGYVTIFLVAYISVLFSVGFDTPLAGNPYTFGVIAALGVFSLPFIARHMGAGFTSITRRIIGGERLPKLENYTEILAGLLSLNGILPLILITFCGIAMWVLSIKIIAAGFGLSVPLTHLATVATLVEIIRLVPITIQGIGLREGAFAYLLAFLGHNPEQCYVVGTIVYLAQSVAIILSGPIGHAMGWRERSKE